MADQESEIIARIAGGVSGLNASAWDRLAGPDPFVGRAFLSALEDSGSVGRGTGWTPAPVLVEDRKMTRAGIATLPADLRAELGLPAE